MEFLKKFFRSFTKTQGPLKPPVPDPVTVTPSIPGYRLLSLLGGGATSCVYLAESTGQAECLVAVGEPVAIKVARPNPENSMLLAERFGREAAMAIKLAGQRVVRFLDSGKTEAGDPYHVMEYVNGFDLAKLSSTHGILPDGRVLEIMRELCKVLGDLHGLGVIHRDVKPSNIMLYCSPKVAVVGESVKLIDFGLAEELRRSSDRTASFLSGTPHYSAPEVWQNPTEVDFRSDIYSLGCCAYQLLTGKPPFSGRNALEICSKHLRADPLDLLQLNDEVSGPLAALVMQCLSKKVGQRASSVHDLAAELMSISPRCPWTELDAESWWNQNSDNSKDSETSR